MYSHQTIMPIRANISIESAEEPAFSHTKTVKTPAASVEEIPITLGQVFYFTVKIFWQKVTLVENSCNG